MGFTASTTSESAQLQPGLVAADGVGPPDGYDAGETLTMDAVAGSFVPAIGVTLPAVAGSLGGGYLYDYYYRIWVFPETLEAQNPSIGTPIPFDIWNAYPQPLTNDITAILSTGAEGLELDFDVGEPFGAIEYRTVNITITPDAGINIDAEFIFQFEAGEAPFYFLANIADFVQMVPDPPVTEEWEWLTDVVKAWSGKEQRIALRLTPRRGAQYGFLLESEVERQRQYNRWYKSLASRIVLPYYQYATSLTQESAAGTSTLYFDPIRTDLRDGEFALVYDALTDAGYLVKIGTMAADGCTLDSPLTFTALPRMIIAPAFTSKLQDGTGLTMLHVTGEIRVVSEALESRVQFTRPGSTAVLNTYDGYPVLDIRPIADGDTPENFDAGVEVIDGGTGIRAIYSAWGHTEVATVRNYTIRRLQNPVEMDWWRDFLDAAKGQQNPFLQPTWLADLFPAAVPGDGSTDLIVNATDYPSLYWPHETFKRLQIETTAGILWRKVLSVTTNEDGTVTLGLDQPFGSTAEEREISKVSFLNLVRLASDRVVLRHERVRTRLSLATRTTDA